MKNPKIPEIILRTWIDIVTSNDSNIDRLSKDAASQKLINAFGSLEEALDFCKKNLSD